jgi:hypothetical protein
VGRLTSKRWLISVREIGEFVRIISSMTDRFIDRISGAEMVKRLDFTMNS